MGNINENSHKTIEQIRREIYERKMQGKETARLETELESREVEETTRHVISSESSGCVSPSSFKSSSTRRIYKENAYKSNAQIRKEISERRAQGKPTGRLERELDLSQD